MKTMRIPRFGRTGTAAVAAALILASGLARPALALDLSGVGEAFKSSVANDVGQCREKITGLNMESVKGVLGCLVDALKKAAANALVGLAKALYDEGVNLLRTNAPAAKEKLQALADKLGAIFSPVKPIAAAVIAGIGAGSSAFADQAATCRDKIVALDLESAKGVFECLKSALSGSLKVAGGEMVRSLFDQAIDLLRTNAPAAKEKLQSLADKLAAVFSPVRAIAGPVIAGINAGSTQFVDEAAKCREQITGLNKESAQGVFGCLKTAFTGAVKTAGIEAVKGFFDEFLDLLRSNCGRAAAKLAELVGKVASVIPQAQSLSGTVLDALNNGCNGALDKAKGLVPIP
jgi:hypothetical protein